MIIHFVSYGILCMKVRALLDTKKRTF